MFVCLVRGFFKGVACESVYMTQGLDQSHKTSSPSQGLLHLYLPLNHSQTQTHTHTTPYTHTHTLPPTHTHTHTLRAALTATSPLPLKHTQPSHSRPLSADQQKPWTPQPKDSVSMCVYMCVCVFAGVSGGHNSLLLSSSPLACKNQPAGST